MRNEEAEEMIEIVDVVQVKKMVEEKATERCMLQSPGFVKMV